MRPWMVLLLACLFSAPAFATGKLTLKPEQDLDNGTLKYSLSLAVDEKLAGPLYYVGWLGSGDDEFDHKKAWYKTEQGIAARMGNLSLGMGVSYTMAMNTEWDDARAYVNAALVLW